MITGSWSVNSIVLPFNSTLGAAYADTPINDANTPMNKADFKNIFFMNVSFLCFDMYILRYFAFIVNTFLKREKAKYKNPPQGVDFYFIVLYRHIHMCLCRLGCFRMIFGCRVHRMSH